MFSHLVTVTVLIGCLIEKKKMASTIPKGFLLFAVIAYLIFLFAEGKFYMSHSQLL